MLQGFCFQLWRVPGQCFLKSLILGANLNVCWAAPGPWSLAHCVYNPWAFQKDGNVQREGLVAPEGRIRSRSVLSLCWNLWSGMNSPEWIDLVFFKWGWPVHILLPEVRHRPLDSPLLSASGSVCGSLLSDISSGPLQGDWLQKHLPFSFFFVMCKQSLFTIEKLETANKQKKKEKFYVYVILSKIIMLPTFYLFIYTQRHINKKVLFYAYYFIACFPHFNILLKIIIYIYRDHCF